MIAPTLADTFVSLAAFLGLVVLIRAIGTFDAGSPLTRRVLFGLRCSPR